VGGAVAPELIRHQLPRLTSLPLQKVAKNPYCRTGVTISLYQDFDHVSVLVHGPPEIVPPDLEEYESSLVTSTEMERLCDQRYITIKRLVGSLQQ